MHLQVWSASVAWAFHLIVAYVLLRAMQLPTSVPLVELAAYTGYSFVPVCITIIVGLIFGEMACDCVHAYDRVHSLRQY